MPDDKPSAELLEHTTRIVAAHVANNAIAAAELPGVITTVHQALATVGTEDAAAKPKPAVSIKRSVKPEYIVCLDDGKKFKMLKRHLKATYNMTPDDYRKRWGLPRDYPMTAPNYAKQRIRPPGGLDCFSPYAVSEFGAPSPTVRLCGVLSFLFLPSGRGRFFLPARCALRRSLVRPSDSLRAGPSACGSHRVSCCMSP